MKRNMKSIAAAALASSLIIGSTVPASAAEAELTTSSFSTSLGIELSETGNSMLSEITGSDLTGLNNAMITVDADLAADLPAFLFTTSINDTEFARILAYLDLENMSVNLQIPDFSDAFARVDISEAVEQIMPLLDFTAEADISDDQVTAGSDMISNLINKVVMPFMGAFAPSAEQKTESITYGDKSADVTYSVMTADAPSLLEAAKTALTSIKDDESLLGMLGSISSQDTSFAESIENAISEIDSAASGELAAAGALNIAIGSSADASVMAGYLEVIDGEQSMIVADLCAFAADNGFDGYLKIGSEEQNINAAFITDNTKPSMNLTLSAQGMGVDDFALNVDVNNGSENGGLGLSLIYAGEALVKLGATWTAGTTAIPEVDFTAVEPIDLAAENGINDYLSTIQMDKVLELLEATGLTNMISAAQAE